METGWGRAVGSAPLTPFPQQRRFVFQESESLGSPFRLLPLSVNSAATAPIAPAIPAAMPLRLAIVAARLGVDGAAAAGVGAGFAAAGFGAGFGAAALDAVGAFGLAACDRVVFAADFGVVAAAVPAAFATGLAAVFGFAAAFAGALGVAAGLVSASAPDAAVLGLAAALGLAGALDLAADFAAAGFAVVVLGVVAMRDNPLFSLVANARAYQIVSGS